MEPYADNIGWQAHFPIGFCLEHDGMVVEQQRKVPPLGLFTVLFCRNESQIPMPYMNGANGTHGLNGNGSHQNGFYGTSMKEE